MSARRTGSDILFALAVTTAAYTALLSLLTLRLFSSYDDIILGLAISALAACLARHTIALRRPDTLLGQCLIECRTAPQSTRIPAAMALVLLALVFDRYLDGDPAHFRPATFIIPVIVSIILFDLKATAFAIAASALAVDFCLIKPMFSFQLVSLSDALDLVLYIFICGQIAIAIEGFIHGESRDKVL